MHIIEEVRRLNLPAEEYIVLGSGILGALGIRAVGDIDLLVSQRVFDELLKAGWAYNEITIEGRVRERLTQGPAEAYKDFWYGGINPNPASLIAGAQMIKGVPFLPLQKLVEIKRVLARPKDARDVVLIEAYLATGVPSFSFGDTPEMADVLLGLVLSGHKRATAWAASLGTQGAEVGKMSVVKDGRGRFRAIIETTELQLRRFDEVDEAFARDEGEGDLTLGYWRDEHRRYFEKEGTFSENMEVYCERFQLVEEITPVP